MPRPGIQKSRVFVPFLVFWLNNSKQNPIFEEKKPLLFLKVTFSPLTDFSKLQMHQYLSYEIFVPLFVFTFA